LKKRCQILRSSEDGKRAICVDVEIKERLLAYIRQSDRHRKKWRHIVELLLGGHRNSELYDKEEINAKCKGVTAMKFFKGQENDRIYCKEQTTENGIFIIVTAELYLKKKSQKVSKKEIPIMEKIGSYDYEIKQPQDRT
jgi:hypothetical protein